MTYAEQRIGDFLAALGERTPAPASGAATALTGALAAGLVQLAAQFANDEAAADRAEQLAARLTDLADKDSAAYTAFMDDRSDANRARIVAVPLEVAAAADEVADLAVKVRAQLTGAVGGDADAAAELARAAARVGRHLAELNR
jgi:formiminotetrahydrofolate cyclodeaminase